MFIDFCTNFCLNICCASPICSGCSGSSVVLLDWAVHRPWCIWGNLVYNLHWFVASFLSVRWMFYFIFLTYFCVETSACSPGQPCPSLLDGTFLCIIRSKLLLFLSQKWKSKSRTKAMAVQAKPWLNWIYCQCLVIAGSSMVVRLWTISRVWCDCESKDRCWHQRMEGDEREENYIKSRK